MLLLDVIKSSVIVALLNLFGKLSGILKTLIVAAYFGASGVLDAFWVAYVIPTMLPVVLRGLLVTVFIPRFMNNKFNSNSDIYWRGANTLFTSVFIIILLFSVTIFLFPGFWVSIFAPGLNDPVHDKAINLVQIMNVATVLLGINAIVIAIANANHKYRFASMEGVITNTTVILFILFFYKSYDVNSVAYGVVAGFGIYSLLLIFVYRKVLFGYLKPCFDFRDKEFVNSVKLMLPAAIGSVSGVLMGIIDQVFVSYLPSGSISILQYAIMISMLPVEVFAQSVMTTFFPTFTQYFSSGQFDKMKRAHISGLKMLLVVMLPSSLLLIYYSTDIVGVLLERGSFDAENTSSTAIAVACLSVGILGRSISYYNFRMFHALSQSWKQVKIGLIQLVINGSLNALLIIPFALNGVALATSISLSFTSLSTIFILQKQMGSAIFKELKSAVIKLLIMSVALVVTCVIWEQAISYLVTSTYGVKWYIYNLLGVIPALVVFCIVGYYLKLKEITSVLSFLQKKIIRN